MRVRTNIYACEYMYNVHSCLQSCKIGTEKNCMQYTNNTIHSISVSLSLSLSLSLVMFYLFFIFILFLVNRNNVYDPISK
jgi:hypothetical protein